MNLDFLPEEDRWLEGGLVIMLHCYILKMRTTCQSEHDVNVY